MFDKKDTSVVDNINENDKKNNLTKKFEKKHTGNFVARLLSLVLAVIVWFYVIKVESPTYEKQFELVPIVLEGAEEMLVSSGYSVISGYDGVVSVTISGKKSDVNRLKTDDIRASIDLSSISLSGNHRLPVNIETGSRIKVVSYEPTNLEVYVDTTLQKDIVTKAQMTYNKEDKIILGECQTNPAQIKVSGPGTIVDKISYAIVDVDFGKIAKSMDAAGQIKLCDEGGNIITNPYIKTNVSSVNVHLPVYKQKYLIPVVKFSDDIIPPQYISTTFEPKTILVQGDSEYIDSLGDTIEVATVDPKEIKDKSTFEILLKSVNDKLEYLDGDTIGIEVRLDSKITNIKKKIPIQLTNENVTVIGLKSGTYTIKPPTTIYVEVRAINQATLDSIVASDVKINVDLSTVTTSGEYKREIVVKFNNPDVYTSEKYNVNFEVKL